MSRVLLFSSGLDSRIAWEFLDKPKCIHITGHSRYSKYELEAVRNMEIPNLDILDIGNWMRKYEEPDATIPMRNAYFCMIAANYGDEICLVCQLGEQSIPDRSNKFFREQSNLLSYLVGRHIEINPVFPNTSKQSMIKWYLEVGYDKKELYKTYSCFSEKVRRCAECASCFRTAVALDYNNILPNNFFAKDIWKWDGIKTYISKLNRGEYEELRTIQTIEVLKKRGIV